MAAAATHTTSTAETSFIAADIRSSGLLKYRWLYHSLFWVLYYGLTMILYLSFHETMSVSFFTMILLQLLAVAAFSYVNLYVLIPRLAFSRKYSLYIFAFLITVIACSALTLLMQVGFAVFIEKQASVNLWNTKGIAVGAIQSVYVFGLVTGIKFVKDSILNQQLQKEREKHYLETELKFLKSQIQPHFFFNTLNNIYSLTLKQSDQAPEVILKLSDLMSYMLYESTAPLVSLVQEIDYLRNYLDVEQLRFGKRLSVSFTIEGRIEEANIPPMILILFLENSFKHGFKNSIGRVQLSIFLQVADGHLFFRVENPASAEEHTGDNNGIGLKNVRRRLDLLYGDRYTLDIREADSFFIISLKIPLC